MKICENLRNSEKSFKSLENLGKFMNILQCFKQQEILENCRKF